jgi:hypothetical protein
VVRRQRCHAGDILCYAIRTAPALRTALCSSLTQRTSPPDIGSLLRKGIGVGEVVLPSVTFSPNGMVITWKTTGPLAQELSYTVRMLLAA